MKLTKSQQSAMNFLSTLDAQGHALLYPNTNKSVNTRALNTLVEKGLVELKLNSRLRTDDMEMVYWRVYQIVPTELIKALS